MVKSVCQAETNYAPLKFLEATQSSGNLFLYIFVHEMKLNYNLRIYLNFIWLLSCWMFCLSRVSSEVLCLAHLPQTSLRSFSQRIETVTKSSRSSWIAGTKFHGHTTSSACAPIASGSRQKTASPTPERVSTPIERSLVHRLLPCQARTRS